MTTILTQGYTAGHYIVGEANTGSDGVSRSIDEITITTGEKLVAGAVIMDDPVNIGNAIEYDASTAAIGILFANNDASATGTNADIEKAVYHARDCSVNGDEIQFNSALTQLEIDAAIVELKAIRIFVKY
jgi:hypothetical protein